MRPITVLVSASGAPGTAALLRALRDNGERNVRLVGTDMSERSVGRHLCDTFHLVPPGFDRGFADAILDVVEREAVDAVPLQSSFDLQGLAEHRERFPCRCSCPARRRSGARTTRRRHTSCFTGWACRRPRSGASRRGGGGVGGSGARIPRPASLLQTGSPSGSRGFRILDPTVDRAHQLLHERPGSVAMRLEEAVERSPPRTAPSSSSWSWQPVASARSTASPTDAGSCSVTRNTRSDARRPKHVLRHARGTPLDDVADRIVAELEIEWFFNIQLVGELVIEVNPRISTIVYQEKDLNLPYLGVKRALGEIGDDELAALGRARPGRTALRYFDQLEWTHSGAAPARRPLPS